MSRSLVEKTIAKVTEQLRGSGSTNTPEPEELKGIRVYKPQVTPSNGLRSEPPIRKRETPNQTFHRYCTELWSIKASRTSICPYCKRPIQIGEEITVFAKVRGWSHLSHAVDEELVMQEVKRL